MEVSPSVESFLRDALGLMGVDLTVPHDDEVMGKTEKGEPLTFAEGKRLGFYDTRGRLIQKAFLGAPDEAEGQAVL